MVSWGMGHNLERNLRKVQGLREKGQLDKALRQLQDWAGSHPDTPHYLYEAAMVAFEMEDWAAGLKALRTLLRNLPDTREKVLTACRERFDETPSLPLAEFLVEADLYDGKIDSAAQVIDRLDDSARDIYARKVAMRQQAFEADDSDSPAARAGHPLILLLACARNDGPTALEAVQKVLDGKNPPVEALRELFDAAGRSGANAPEFDFANAHLSLAASRPRESARLALRAGQRSADLRDAIGDFLSKSRPSGEDAGYWSMVEGQLSLLRGSGEECARFFLEAADSDASLRDELLEHLGGEINDRHVHGAAELAKLRLRLLVVQKRFDEIPTVTQEILAAGLAEAHELRALLGEDKQEDAPSEMLVVLAETALRDQDLAATATHAAEIPDSDDKALRRLQRAIEDERDRWPEDSKLELEALRTVLLSRSGDREATNGALERLWTEYPESIETLQTLTDRCLERVEANPVLLAAAIPVVLRAGEPGVWTRRLQKLLGGSGEAPSADGQNSPFFAHDDRLLDFGSEEEEDRSDEIQTALMSALESDPSIAGPMLALLDALPEGVSASDRMRHLTALAALWSDAVDRGLPSLSVVVMMAEPALQERVAQQLDHALQLHPDHAGLLAVRADVLADLGRTEEASDHLGRAMRADPLRAEEFAQRYEHLAEQAEEQSRGRVWREYAKALFDVGRFEKLNEVCACAADSVEAHELAEILELQIKSTLSEGRVSTALQAIQKNVVAKQLAPETAMHLLEDAIVSQPSSSIAHIMLGQMATRAGQIGRAVVAYRDAVRIDDSLSGRVAEQVDSLAADSRAQSPDLVQIAEYHRERGDTARAGASFQRALRVDPSLAERVLGDLRPLLEREDSDLDLLLVAAQAARHAQQVGLAVRTLQQIDRHDAGRLESVLAELRHLREDHPADLAPIVAMVQVLLNHDAPAAAAQTAADAAETDDYPVEGRLEFLKSLSTRMPERTAVQIGLAYCLAESGRVEDAIAQMRSVESREDFDADRAERLLQRLRAELGEDPELRLAHHDLLVRLGRIDEALEKLPVAASMAAVRQEELSSRLLDQSARVAASESLTLQLIESLDRQERPEDAIAALLRAVDDGGADWRSPLHVELARRLIAAGQTEEAGHRLSAHIERTGQERDEALELFANWTEQRDRSEVEGLRTRLRQQPSSTTLAIDLATLLLSLERPQPVIELFDDAQILAEDPTRRAALMARAHLMMGRADRAEAILMGADRSTPDGAECEYLLATCIEQLGRFGEAHARFQRLITDPVCGPAAEIAARRTYDHYVREVAGEHRAVLEATTSL